MSTTSQYLGTAGHCAATFVCGIFGLAWLGAAFYVGREVAQAEYRYIEAHGGKRDECPWYCGLLPSAWTVKGMLDWMLPVLIAIAFTLVSASINGGL